MNLSTEASDQKYLPVICVHVGAGFHSRCKSQHYKNCMVEACISAMKILSQPEKVGCENSAINQAMEAVAEAVRVLEDNPLTNAGLGSNLTSEGKVECDALIMTSPHRSCGAVSGVSRIKNPILLAYKIACEEKKGLLSFGRIAPIFLTGLGAEKWAAKFCSHLLLENSDPPSLKTPQTLKTHHTYKNWLENSEPSRKHTRAQKESQFQDTVGAVCIDSQGNIAAAVSSGGIAYKHSGRVGEAALMGAGCWAEVGASFGGRCGAGCSASGAGEFLMKSMLSFQCCREILGQQRGAASRASVDQIIGKIVEREIRQNGSPVQVLKNCGLLSVHFTDAFIEVCWAHNTPSMGVAGFSLRDEKPWALISRQKASLGENGDSRLLISGKSWVL